ncbi:cation:proton antiporter [Sulfurospirillum sp. 1612]|uniref:cation:proton antiporter n=1 Tax=Sulfurospirillum sp. 1612 TaxID=3094835 RepID=UPI002F9320F4
MNEIAIIVTISVILSISPFFSKLLRIPTPAIEIMMGTIGAYYGFLSDHYLFKLIAEVGFFYLMFMAGMEVDLRLFNNKKAPIMREGFLYLVLLYAVSFLGILYFDLDKILIILLPMISVGLILALHKDYGKDARWLNLSMVVGTMGELTSIALLTFAGAALEYGIGIELYKTILYLVLFLLGIFLLFKCLRIVFWWYPELKTFLMPHFDKEEKDIRLSMAIFFLLIAIMVFLHLEVAFGAFIAGIFINTFFEHKKELPEKLSSFGFGFLVPVFFIYIGSTFKLDALLSDGLITNAMLITAIMIFARILASFVFIKMLSVKEVILFGLSHSMPLTLLIAVATIAYNSHSINYFLYLSFVLASIFEVILVMLSIKIIMAFGLKNKPHHTKTKRD